MPVIYSLSVHYIAWKPIDSRHPSLVNHRLHARKKSVLVMHSFASLSMAPSHVQPTMPPCYIRPAPIHLSIPSKRRCPATQIGSALLITSTAFGGSIAALYSCSCSLRADGRAANHRFIHLTFLSQSLQPGSAPFSSRSHLVDQQSVTDRWTP